MNMNDLQRSILIISIALVALLCTLILRTTDNLGEKVPVPEEEFRFDSSNACKKAQQLATLFPDRGTGTEGSRAAAEWLEAEMKGLGLKTEQQEFDAWIAGEQVTGRNVIGIDKGIRDEAVIVVAHYDIPFHVKQGAMDDASGVGVVLELARIFARRKQIKTLIFIASDAEEWGMLGARHYVRDVPEKGKIRAAISLDYVRLEKSNTIYLRGVGQFRGQTPLWLWMLAEDCISAAGGEPKSPNPLDQYIFRAVDISSTDQGPFLRWGIPAINFGGNMSESPLARRVYHTTLDTSENLRPELFTVVGRSTELMVRTLDRLDYSTDNNQYYLRMEKRTYVSRRGLYTLQILLFIPLLLATGFQYSNLMKRKDFVREALAELGNIALFLLPWIIALFALYLLVWRNVIPRYELYPATPLDPFLKMTHWKALGGIASACAAAWVAVVLVRHYFPFAKTPDFASSKAVCLDVLLTFSIIALVLNGFAASLFLAPAALLWGWIESGRGAGRISLNILLVFAAAIPLILLIITFAKQLNLGLYVGWYMLLGAGYGLFSPVAIIIAFGTGVIGVRLVQQSFATQADSTEPETEKE